MAKNIARDGAPKRAHGTVPVHGGMHFLDRPTEHGQPGKLNACVTHKAIANAPDASDKRPLDPTNMGKLVTQPAAVINHRHRATDKPHGGHPGENIARGSRTIDHELGRRVMDQAYGASTRA